MAGLAFTVTTCEEVPEHPFASVTVTVNVPDEFTVMDCVVCALFQLYEFAAKTESVTLPPLQKVVAPLAVMVAFGNEFTVTVVAAELAVQPLPSVMVTE